MPRVEYCEDAVRDLEKIDGDARRVILAAIGKKLGTAPEQYGDQLGRRKGGSLVPFRKLKVGQRGTYRVVYHVHRDDDPEDPILVIVWIVAKRSDDEVYRDAMARIESLTQQDAAGQLAPDRLEQVLAKAWQR
ncbi:type II toxin-antitoxin system RelE family toxin [Mycolicibacter sinensis]